VNAPQGWMLVSGTPNYEHHEGFVAIYDRTCRGYASYSVYFADENRRNIHTVVSVGGLPTSDVLRAAKRHRKRAQVMP